MASKVKARLVSTWLNEVIKWKDSSSVEHNLFIFTKLDELAKFLQQLESTLSTMISVSEALEQLPDVGQLLGRLCSIPAVLCHRASYMSLLKCILWFVVENPVTPLEERSKTWALTQIRSTVCVKQDDLTQHLMNQTGHLIRDFAANSTEEILKAALTHYKPGDRTWNESFQCFVVGIINQLPDQSPNIISLCLKFYHKEPFRHFIDVMVETCSISTDTKMMTELSSILYSYQNEFLQGKLPAELSYKVLRILWGSDMAYLENTVLYILEKCTESYTRLKEMIKIINITQLDKACSDGPMIYLGVIKVLQGFLKESDNDVRVVDCVWALTRAVYVENQNSQKNQHSYWEDMKLGQSKTGPVNLKHLIHSNYVLAWDCLQSFYQGTPYSLHLRMLTIIDLDNESRQSADRTRLWFLLLQHSHILYIGLHTALTDMDIPFGVWHGVIQAYGYFCDSKACKDRVEDFSVKLRKLLKSDDDCISLPVSLTPSQSSACQHCNRGLDQLLLQFMISMHTDSTNIAEDVLFQVCQSKDPKQHLDTLIRYLDGYLFTVSFVPMWYKSIDKVYIEILCNKLIKEICNHGDVYKDQQSQIDGLFEKTRQIIKDLDNV